METSCERRNIKINEDKTQGINFFLSRRPPESRHTLNGRNIPFVNIVKYLGVVFDKKVTWRLYIEMMEAKAFRTLITAYSLLKSERLRAKIKFTPHKALIRSINIYACTAWEFAVDNHLLKLHRLRNKVLGNIDVFPRRYTGSPCAYGFQTSYIYDCITLLSMQQAEVMQNHENANVRNIGQDDARQRKCKRFKVGNGEAYDRSSD
jgi:hypothetical protein